jgi:hypothetical protein
LGYGEETPVAVQCLLHRLDGSGSPRRDGHSDPGVHDGITKGQDRKREALRHRILFSLDVVDAGKGSFSDRVNAPAFVDFPFLGTFNPPTSIARRLDERDA